MDPISNAEVVRTFYAALAGCDSDTVTALVDARFHDDAVLVLPDSLPYGGVIRTARRLGRMFTAMAAADSVGRPGDLRLVDVIDGGDRVGAELRFDWRAPGTAEQIATGALELWRFSDGTVREIRAYYQDTAACVRLVEAAST